MRISRAVRSEWSAILAKAVPSTLIQDDQLMVPAEYGFIRVLYKEEGKAEDYELVVGGYASPQVIDRERHLITKEAMAADLPRFLAHPKYRNAMIVHCQRAGAKVKVGPGVERYKAIEDVRPGDMVYTHKGRLRPVTAVTRHEGPALLVRVALENGDVLHLTENHRLLTTQGWVEAAELTADHVLNHLVKRGHRSWQLEESTGYRGRLLSKGLPRNETDSQRDFRMAQLRTTKAASGKRANGALATAEQRRGKTLTEVYGEGRGALWVTRIADSQRDERSHFWKGGVSRRPYGAGFSGALKELVRDRDGRACVLCGRAEAEELADYGRRLSVDHISWDKADHDPLNLRALCVFCHGARNGEARETVANGVRVTSVVLVPNSEPVYNLEVAEDSSYAGRGCIHHNSNIQVGEVLPKWCHPKTGECFETKVDDIGLFCLVKIRTDKYRPEICEKVEKDVLAGKLASFSISGDAPFDARRHVCHDGACFWIIDKIVFYEITVCELGVNQDAKFSILSKMAHCTSGSCPIDLPRRLTSSVITKTLDAHVHKQTGTPTAPAMPKQPPTERPTRQDPSHADVGQRAGSAMGTGSLPRGELEKGEVTVADDFAKQLWEEWGRPFSFDQFKVGIGVEWEHASTVGGDWDKVVAITLDHLREDPDYYTKLEGADINEGPDAETTVAVGPAEWVQKAKPWHHEHDGYPEHPVNVKDHQKWLSEHDKGERRPSEQDPYHGKPGVPHEHGEGPGEYHEHGEGAHERGLLPNMEAGEPPAVTKEISRMREKLGDTERELDHWQGRFNELRQTRGAYDNFTEEARRRLDGAHTKKYNLEQRIENWQGLKVHPNELKQPLEAAGIKRAEWIVSHQVRGYGHYTSGYTVEPAKGKLLVNFRSSNITTREQDQARGEKLADILSEAGFEAKPIGGTQVEVTGRSGKEEKQQFAPGGSSGGGESPGDVAGGWASQVHDPTDIRHRPGGVMVDRFPQSKCAHGIIYRGGQTFGPPDIEYGEAEKEEKASRRYISDPSAAPSGVKPQRGVRGGWYYEPQGRPQRRWESERKPLGWDVRGQPTDWTQPMPRHMADVYRRKDPAERQQLYAQMARTMLRSRHTGTREAGKLLFHAAAAAQSGDRRREAQFVRMAADPWAHGRRIDRHMTPQPHGHIGGSGQAMPQVGRPQLPQAATLRRPRPFKPGSPMIKGEDDFKVKIKGDPEDVKEFLSKAWMRKDEDDPSGLDQDNVWPPEDSPGVMGEQARQNLQHEDGEGWQAAGKVRDDAAGGEESEEYYLNKHQSEEDHLHAPDFEDEHMTGEESDRFYQACPLCAAREVIEKTLDNRDLYSVMSPEFRGILRHSLAALRLGTGELDYVDGPGWVVLAGDHSLIGFTEAGYAIPLTEVMQAIGASAFERGLVGHVAAAMDAGSGLLNLTPLDETTFKEQLTKALRQASESTGDPSWWGAVSVLTKGYSVGWLGQAQRLLAQLTTKLHKVKKDNMPDHIKLALASLAEDLGHLENALGVTEELKGAIKGVEEPELNVVREVAKNTEGDVERADDALAAVDPELDKERTTERYERDNPDQDAHPAEVAVMTGAPPGVPTENPNELGRDDTKDPTISRAVRNMPRIEKQTGPDSDLWGAQNRGAGRRALGPTTEELDTPDQGQHPAYEFNRPLREAIDVNVPANRGVATTGSEQDPDALVDYSTGPPEPRWPDDPSTAGEVHKKGLVEKDKPAQWAQDRAIGDPSRIRNAPELDVPVRVHGAGEPSEDGYFQDQGPATEVITRQPIREREFDSRGAIREETTNVPIIRPPRLKMGNEDAKALFKLHASMWSRYVTDKKLALAVVRLDEDGNLEVIDVAER